MISAKQTAANSRALWLLTEALETAITLGERVNAQAEQIARVRGLHRHIQKWGEGTSDLDDICAHCVLAFPCPTIRALGLAGQQP